MGSSVQSGVVVARGDLTIPLNKEGIVVCKHGLFTGHYFGESS